MKLKMITCPVCNSPMPELRLTQYGYESCVDCSTVGAYTAVTTVNGEGDHTWNDIQIMTPDQAKKHSSLSKQKPKFDSYNQDA
jgi:hypothetical protein